MLKTADGPIAVEQSQAPWYRPSGSCRKVRNVCASADALQSADLDELERKPAAGTSFASKPVCVPTKTG